MDTVSWITGTSANRDELLDLRPALAIEHRAVLDAVWSGPVSSRTLELCRLRTAMLLGNRIGLGERTPHVDDLDETTIGAIAGWPSDDRFSEVDRACLALSEQYILDVHGVTDELVDRATDSVGADGVVTLTTALALWELTHRFDTALLDTALLDTALIDGRENKETP